MTWALFGKLLHLLVKQRLAYRADFLLGIIGQILYYGGTYVVTWLFLQRFESIAGWTWPEVALLYSIGLFTYAIGASFSYVQMREIEDQVRTGTFDGILTKPVNPYLYIVCRGFNLAYIAHILISGSVLLWALGQLDVEWTLARAVYFAASLLSGAMIQAGIMSAIGACAFFFVRTKYLFSLFFRLKEFISYPMSVYGSFVQLLLGLVVPLAFINFVPGAYLLGKETGVLPEWAGWLAPFVGPLCLWLGYRFWNAGIDRYQGAGG